MHDRSLLAQLILFFAGLGPYASVVVLFPALLAFICWIVAPLRKLFE